MKKKIAKWSIFTIMLLAIVVVISIYTSNKLLAADPVESGITVTKTAPKQVGSTIQYGKLLDVSQWELGGQRELRNTYIWRLHTSLL